ncbi:MAG: hypothetical protein IPK85_06060 [Gemmatimonadetes bacterium]|nr:hypothetical protein [Gemmatimonadota bacterium]
MTTPLRRTVRWLCAVAITGLMVDSAHAQAPTLDLVPGTRVRVTSANQVAPLIANFMSLRGDTAMFIEEGSGRGIWSIQLGDIRKIERSDGEKRSNRPYMIRGAAVGGVVGLVGGIAFSNSAKPSTEGREYNKWGTASIAAVLGAGLGAAIGTRFATEKWTDVPLRRVALTPMVGPAGAKGIRASVSLAF